MVIEAKFTELLCIRMPGYDPKFSNLVFTRLLTLSYLSKHAF